MKFLKLALLKFLGFFGVAYKWILISTKGLLGGLGGKALGGFGVLGSFIGNTFKMLILGLIAGGFIYYFSISIG